MSNILTHMQTYTENPDKPTVWHGAEPDHGRNNHLDSCFILDLKQNKQTKNYYPVLLNYFMACVATVYISQILYLAII